MVSVRHGDIKGQLLSQEGIRPAFEDAAFYINGQVSPLRIQNSFDILALQTLSNLVRLAEQMQVAVRRDLANEGDSPGRDGQRFDGNGIAGWKFLKFALPSVFLGVQTAEPSLDMLGIYRLFQTLQFTSKRRDPGKMSLEQAWLEESVEIFHAAIVLGSGRWDKHRLDREMQTESDYSRQVPCGRTPAEVLASVVQLDLVGPSETLPGVAEEVENGFHMAGTAQF